MAFSKNYIADTRTLAVITQTVGKKSSLIPGITVKADLAGLVQANVAEYYFNLAPNVGDVLAGDDFSSTNAGSKKAVMPLTRGLHIDEKIPNVAIDATTPDLILDRTVKGALAIANKLGQKFMADLVGLAKVATYTAGLDFYQAVVEAIGTYSGALSANVGGVTDTTFSNRENGIQPTAIVVGDFGRAALLGTDAFQRLIQATGEVPGLIGEMLGLNVVYSQDLDGIGGAPEFMLLNHEGVAYPFSINTMRVVESEQFNGVRVQAEIGYAAANNFAVLPIDSFAIKFTEAA